MFWLLLQGQLKIDPKSYKNSYVAHPVFFMPICYKSVNEQLGLKLLNTSSDA